MKYHMLQYGLCISELWTTYALGCRSQMTQGPSMQIQQTLDWLITVCIGITWLLLNLYILNSIYALSWIILFTGSRTLSIKSASFWCHSTVPLVNSNVWWSTSDSTRWIHSTRKIHRLDKYPIVCSQHPQVRLKPGLPANGYTWSYHSVISMGYNFG